MSLSASQVMEAWNASGGSAGASSILTIVFRDAGVNMERWLAGKLMKELDIASCQVQVKKYKHDGNEHFDRATYTLLNLIVVILTSFQDTKGWMHPN